jgi:hypothetical protein
MSTEMQTETPIADAMRRYGESLPDPEDQPAVPGFITIEQFAYQMNVALSTARRWKARGYGPKFIKIGRRDYCLETGAADFVATLFSEAEARDRPRRRR